MTLYEFDAQANAAKYKTLAGVDEAGRGPLAGPVVAAAVILRGKDRIDGLNDSKKLSPAKREKLFTQIMDSPALVGVGIESPETVDTINILQASLLAMLRAVEALGEAPGLVLIDGNQLIKWSGVQKAVVKGDTLSASIAAASIIAKVTRDKIMAELAVKYPEYGFERHKGYGSVAHREAIAKHGPCPVHRKTFKGVREYINAK